MEWCLIKQKVDIHVVVLC